MMLLQGAAAVNYSNRYRSPRNPERKVRSSTDFIVLHTTEAPARSSLNKVSERGECHYCVTEDGTVYRIVDRDREAFHAGRSMWNAREDLDKYTIGIECVGYHNKPMSLLQLYAIRDLVKELQAMYRLPDERVVTHSQIAYGAPNKWHKKRHRGRKRCAMLFAMPSVRRILNLKKRMGSDPDVRAKRLTIGDPYLHKVLYGSTDTMRNTYANVSAPTKQSISSRILKWFKKPAAAGAQPQPKPKSVVKAKPKPTVKPSPKSSTPKVTKPKAQTPRKPASQPVAAPKTIADLKKQGYRLRGTVKKGTTASKIAGSRWNRPTTFYTIRDKVIPGNQINPARIEVGMGVWMK